MAIRKTAMKKEPRRLTRYKVLIKAIRLADKHGLDSLSMRKLADALNVEAMSLYNHVKNKDDLLDGMVELVIEKFETPKSNGQWQIAMYDCVINTHLKLLEHPWAVSLLISRVRLGDASLRFSDKCYGCLIEAGFSSEQSDHAWDAIQNYLYGFTLSQINMPVDPLNFADAAVHYEPLVTESEYPHVHAIMQSIIGGKHSGINNIEFGLSLILDGLERLRITGR